MEQPNQEQDQGQIYEIVQTPSTTTLNDQSICRTPLFTISKVDDYFKCSVCYSVPLQPVVCSHRDCDTVFCKQCIQMWHAKNRNKKKCPCCRGKWKEEKLSRKIRHLFNDLNCRCSQCSEEVKYQNIESHLVKHWSLDMNPLLEKAHPQILKVYETLPPFEFYPLPQDFNQTARVFNSFHEDSKGRFWIGESKKEKLKDGQTEICLDGRGAFLTRKGILYIGFWREGELYGKVRIIYQNGSFYEGSFQNGAANGEGCLTHSNGYKFDGNFTNCELEGPGQIIFPDKSIFKGNFTLSKLNGKGQFICPIGSIFDCEFQDSEISKIYSVTDLDGSKYEGDFKDLKRHGQGLSKDSEGNIIYQGQWQDDQKHGYGAVISNGLEACQQLWCKGQLIRQFTQNEQDQGLVNVQKQEIQQVQDIQSKRKNDSFCLQLACGPMDSKRQRRC